MPKRHFQIMLLALALIVMLAACQSPAGTTGPAAGEETAAPPPGEETAAVPPVNEAYPTPGASLAAEDILPTAYPSGGEASMPPASNPGGNSAGLWSAYPPAPGDQTFARSEFFVEAASLLPNEEEEGAYDVIAEGALPTPCHTIRAEVNPPDAGGQIVVDVYSLVDENVMCTQVLQPFSGKVATLTGLPPGTYTVVVKDQPAGEIVVE